MYHHGRVGFGVPEGIDLMKYHNHMLMHILNFPRHTILHEFCNGCRRLYSVGQRQKLQSRIELVSYEYFLVVTDGSFVLTDVKAERRTSPMRVLCCR